MKKINLKNSLLAILLISSISSFTYAQTSRSQGHQPKKERIAQLKIAFITQELNLSSSEAEAFWPIYNELSDKLKIENGNRKKLSSALRSESTTMSDSEMKEKTNAIFDSEIKEAQLKKEYTNKIAVVIGQKKATKLLSLEQRFKRELLNKLNESKQGPPQGRRPGGPRSMD